MKFDKIFSMIIKITSYFAILILVFIIFFIAKESTAVFKEISFLDFLFGTKWHPTKVEPQIEILPMVLATIYVSVVAIVISLPIGVGTAVFLSTVINKKVKKVFDPLIDILAGIPSVVYGLLGFVFLVKFFEKYFLFSSGESVLAGGILLSIMILPYVISTVKESMIKIQEKYQVSSQALGVSKWHMIRYLILPASKKSIIAALILAFGRAMGETMAVMMVIGNSPILPKLLGRAQTIPSLIALEMSGAQLNSLHYHSLYAAGLLLMLILFVINIIFYYLKENSEY